jgi:hypothetical protein
MQIWSPLKLEQSMSFCSTYRPLNYRYELLVEHSPPHPKVKGASKATASVTASETILKNYYKIGQNVKCFNLFTFSNLNLQLILLAL